MTHPFHPWHGQRFEFVDCRRCWGEWRVFYYTENGQMAYFPSAWTDAGQADPFVVLSRGHPHWSRRRLSIALCEVLDWRTASGQLKDMSARLLLNKLAEGGFIELPPRQRGGGRRVLRALWEPTCKLSA